jgi:hypothetical protein
MEEDYFLRLRQTDDEIGKSKALIVGNKKEIVTVGV